MAGLSWLRRLLLIVAAGAAAGPVLAQTKVLRIVPQADLVNLDPGFGSNLITREYGLMVFEELFAWDAKLQPKPMMVESWSASADGLTWRFTLRDGLKFHDGQVVTTTDVIASLTRWTKNDLVGGLVGAAIGSFTPVDAKTFEISLKQPFPSLLFALGAAVGQVPVIMRAKDLQADPDLRSQKSQGRRSTQPTARGAPGLACSCGLGTCGAAGRRFGIHASTYRRSS